MNDIREEIFTTVARLSPLLPAVRGRTRLFLALFDLLGLKDRHILVEAQLRRPLRFRARLDLHSWLERVAFLTGGYGDDKVDFLLRLHDSLRRPGYLFDIGANIGLISIPFALALNARAEARDDRLPLVISLEALSDNVEVLRRNVGLNHLEPDVIASRSTRRGQQAGRYPGQGRPERGRRNGVSKHPRRRLDLPVRADTAADQDARRAPEHRCRPARVFDSESRYRGLRPEDSAGCFTGAVGRLTE